MNNETKQALEGLIISTILERAGKSADSKNVDKNLKKLFKDLKNEKLPVPAILECLKAVAPTEENSSPHRSSLSEQPTAGSTDVSTNAMLRGGPFHNPFGDDNELCDNEAMMPECPFGDEYAVDDRDL